MLVILVTNIMSAPRKNKSHLCFHGFVTASSPGVVATPVSGSRVAFVAFSLRITAFLVIIGQKCHVSFFWSEVPCFFLGFSTFAKKEASALGVVLSRNHSWNKFGGDAALQLMSEKYLFPFFCWKTSVWNIILEMVSSEAKKGKITCYCVSSHNVLSPPFFFPFSSEHGSEGAHHNFSSSRLVGSFFPHKMVSRTPIITFLPQHLSRATMAL